MSDCDQFHEKEGRMEVRKEGRKKGKKVIEIDR